MKTSRCIGFSVVVMSLIILAGCSGSSVIVRWQDNPEQTGSTPRQWIPDATTDRAAAVSYAISNDDENVYFFMRTSDRANQMKMLRRGVVLSLDTTGRSEEHISIRYPYFEEDFQPPAASNRPADGTGTQQSARAVAVNESLDNMRQMHVAGFVDHPNGVIPSENPRGVRVRMRMDDDEQLYYWAIVPISAFLTKMEGQGDDSGKLALQVSLLGLEMPQMGAGGRRPPSDVLIPSGTVRPAPGREGGDAGMQGQGMGGRGQQGGDVNMDRLTSTQNVRVEFLMASRPQ